MAQGRTDLTLQTTEGEIDRMVWGALTKHLRLKFGMTEEETELMKEDEARAELKKRMREVREKAKKGRRAGQAAESLQEILALHNSKREHLAELCHSIAAFLPRLDKGTKDILKTQFGRSAEDIVTDVQTQLHREECPILVAGETSSGKSTFLNLLLGENILPVAPLSSTSTICEVKYGETRQAVVHLRKSGIIGKITGPKTVTIPLDGTKEHQQELKSYMELDIYIHVRGASRDQLPPAKRVEIFWPLPLLQGGIVLVDSPGVGETDMMDELVADYIPKSFAFLYIINSSRAGGVQQDRLGRLLHLYVRKDNCGDFNPESAMFICNKWDIVKPKEEDKVKSEIFRKLSEMWPGLEESQVFFVSTRKAVGPFGILSEDFSKVLEGLDLLLPKALDNKLETQYRLLTHLMTAALELIFSHQNLHKEAKLKTWKKAKEHLKSFEETATHAYEQRSRDINSFLGQLTMFHLTKMRKYEFELDSIIGWTDTRNRIGGGGFGEVYRVQVQWKGAETLAALKLGIMPYDMVSDNTAWEFLKEEDNLRKLRGAHIVEYYGTAACRREAGGLRLGLVMELCEGTLEDRIIGQRGHNPVWWKCNPEKKAAAFSYIKDKAIQLCEGLKTIHDAGYIHRDLKLSNVLVTSDDTVKLADVGLTKREDKITGTIAGTAIYVAPEVKERQVYDKSADIYSLGLILWEMWYGITLYGLYTEDIDAAYAKEMEHDLRRGRDIRMPEWPDAVPPIPEWTRLIHDCLKKDPRKRPKIQDCLDRISDMMVKKKLEARPQNLQVYHTMLGEQRWRQSIDSGISSLGTIDSRSTLSLSSIATNWSVQDFEMLDPILGRLEETDERLLMRVWSARTSKQESSRAGLTGVDMMKQEYIKTGELKILEQDMMAAGISFHAVVRDIPGVPDELKYTRTTVGPLGGDVEIPDFAKLIVPPGVLQQHTRITMSSVDVAAILGDPESVNWISGYPWSLGEDACPRELLDQVLFSPAFDVNLHGAQLSGPVEVQTWRPPGSEGMRCLLLRHHDEKGWTDITASTSHHTDSDRLSILVQNFSVTAILWAPVTMVTSIGKTMLAAFSSRTVNYLFTAYSKPGVDKLEFHVVCRDQCVEADAYLQGFKLCGFNNAKAPLYNNDVIKVDVSLGGHKQSTQPENLYTTLCKQGGQKIQTVLTKPNRYPATGKVDVWKFLQPHIWLPVCDLTIREEGDTSTGAASQQSDDATKLLELQKQVTDILRANFPSLNFVPDINKEADERRIEVNRTTLRAEGFSNSVDLSLDSVILDLIQERKKSVCRINWPGGSGTGFLLSKGKVLTCYHVYELMHKARFGSSPEASHYSATFFVSVGREYKVPFEAPAAIRICHSEDLDYAILQLAVRDVEMGRNLEGLPLLGHFISESIDCRKMVVLVGHPSGGNKVVDFACVAGKLLSFVVQTRFANLIQEDEHKPLYNTSVMFHGSSGSPGFDTYGNVVLMHTRGFFPDKSSKSLIERGVLLSAIRDHARQTLAPEFFNEIFPVMFEDVTPMSIG